MPSITAPSSIFAGFNAPSVLSSEAASSFIDWKRPSPPPRPYRGQLQTPPVGDNRGALLTQVQALTARVVHLQEAMDESSPASTAVAQVAAELSDLDQQAKLDTSTTIVGSAGAAPYFDSCAKFASEAARVRHAGRLPFSSDCCKISAHAKPY